MGTSLDELQKPPTEIEIGELIVACNRLLSPAGMMILRRLIFQRDRLKTLNQLQGGSDTAPPKGA